MHHREQQVPDSVNVLEGFPHRDFSIALPFSSTQSVLRIVHTHPFSEPCCGDRVTQ
jgi:hypothetical protein